MQLHFNAISEPAQPGPKWQKLFNTFWPAYNAWLNAKGAAYVPDLKTSQAALKYYMPEMLPNYERLCTLANADDIAARFLTGFQPPAYVSACSQAVMAKGKVQLVRNYDYHPDLIEGTMLLSAWNGKKVIGNSDCLSGVLDGMNEDGLAISLTFGGRKEVGKGFGIPFILRYVLEFCSNVQEAVEALTRVPSHMSYNVTVVDRSGAFKTVRLAPDKKPFVSNAAYTTNHQGVVDWPENAAFNKTIERAEFLEKRLLENGLDVHKLADSFLHSPLYNTRFKEGFGTLYTAIYCPAEGTVKLLWPKDKLLQNFDDFQEKYILIKYEQVSEAITSIPEAALPIHEGNGEATYSNEWQEELADNLVNGMAQTASTGGKKRLNTWKKNIIHRGQISWEILADYWSNLGKEYWQKWLK